MDLSSPDSWWIIWAIVAVAAGVGEMLMPGTFFLLPFAIGAFVATIASVLDAPVWLGWLLFVTVTALSFAVLIPIRNRINQSEEDIGVGSKRLLGKEGVVTQRIDAEPGAAGEIRIDRELWRATGPKGTVLEEGTIVRVVGVEGTRAIVEPAEAPAEEAPGR
jgi:membrane protein implicated in regulation of membrane protease activity